MTDELIAALELAERELEGWATWHMLYTSADADKYRSAAERIRALIADLRAGNLVRREEVVAEERATVVAWLRAQSRFYDEHKDARAVEGKISDFADMFADAIAAGEHTECPDDATGCADDQIWRDVPASVMRKAIGAGHHP